MKAIKKEYVVSESPKYGLYCVSRDHLRKYQKFVPIGSFISFKKAQSYLSKNKKNLAKKMKNAKINYSEPNFTNSEIKQKIKYGANYSYKKQNGPVIITKQSKFSKNDKNSSEQDFSYFKYQKFLNNQEHSNNNTKIESCVSKKFILIKIYKNSKNEFCSKSIIKRFKSSSEDLLYSNLLKYCSKYNITIYSEILY